MPPLTYSSDCHSCICVNCDDCWAGALYQIWEDKKLLYNLVSFGIELAAAAGDLDSTILCINTIPTQSNYPWVLLGVKRKAPFNSTPQVPEPWTVVGSRKCGGRCASHSPLSQDIQLANRFNIFIWLQLHSLVIVPAISAAPTANSACTLGLVCTKQSTTKVRPGYRCLLRSDTSFWNWAASLLVPSHQTDPYSLLPIHKLAVHRFLHSFDASIPPGLGSIVSKVCRHPDGWDYWWRRCWGFGKLHQFCT